MPMPQPSPASDSQSSDTEEEGDSPPKLLSLPFPRLEKQERKEWAMRTLQKSSFPALNPTQLEVKPVNPRHKPLGIWFASLAIKQLLIQTTLVLRVSARLALYSQSDTSTVQRTCREEHALTTFRKRLPALVQGWKTRRVLRSWVLSVCLRKVQVASRSERPFCVAELKHMFAEEYRSGKWMRVRKRPCPFLKRNRTTQRISLPQPEPFTTAETSSPSPQSARPFLKRKSKRVLSQQLTYHSVSTRVNCWHRSKAKRYTNCLKRNSLEEFVVLEKRSQVRIKQKLPVPQTETPLRRQLGLGALKVCMSEAELQRPQVQARLFKLEPKKELR